MSARFVRAMAPRVLRAAAGRFALYGGCMAIGIAVVVGLHALRDAVDRAVDLRARDLLGADLQLESRDPFGPDLREALGPLEALARTRGAGAPTEITRLGSMALAERSGRSRLVELFAIEGRYPIHGEVLTQPSGGWRAFGDRPGRVFVDASLLLQLDVGLGERLKLGDVSFEIAGSVTKAPGSVGLQSDLAPRVYLLASDLARTGLVQEGSLVSHGLQLGLPDGVVEPWVERHEALLESARVRVRTVRGYQEELSEAFGSLTRFLGLVGLAALVLGSIGVATGMRAYVREQLDGVAVMRALGATPGTVVALYGVIAAVLGGASGLFGIVLCGPALAALPKLLDGLLPVEVEIGLRPAAIATGLGLALWATALCALGPVLDLARVAPLRALRRDFDAEADASVGARRWSVLAAIASLALASVWQAGDARVGLWFAAGLLGAIALLAVAARLLAAGLRRHPPEALAFWARQGIANLFRPRNHTLPTTIAIGFALFVVATLHGVERNVLEQLAVDARPDRPNFVLFDVQRDQLSGVEALLASHEARITDRAPLVSARLAAVADVARETWLADEAISRERKWALQREYRLTWADDLRDSEEIVAGEWWAPGSVSVADEPYPVSVERDLARSLGLGLGDRLRWRIQGVDVETRVASLRRVDWGRMATNFFVVFPPAALEHAPQSTVLLAHLPDEASRAALQRALVGAFPNVSALDATLVLRSLDTMFGQIALAVRVLSLVTLATGLAILLAAALAARHERAREAVLLRVLGASRSVLRRIAATEAWALAALAVAVGALAAVLASWALVVLVFELPFEPPWLDWLGLAGATFAITALVGGLAAMRRAARSPLERLRSEVV
ncbi:MAG: FtsX-like permease family protein [Myxococcales bacterium]|nr:FtsX-like permease family protein [Myxococcales bacterium]